MRVIFTFLMVLSFAFLAKGQQLLIEPAPGMIVNGLKPEEGGLRTGENYIWYEDFSEGIPADWTQETDPSNAVWEYRGPNTTPNINVGTRGSCISGGAQFGAPIQSPTASNGFVIFDSNFWDDNIGPCGNTGSGEAPGPHFAALVTNELDFSAYPNLGLRFNQFFRNNQANTRVEYSLSGGEWLVLWENDVPPMAGQTPPDRSDRVNVSAQIGGQSNVRLRFVFDGFYYYWMIDDIGIFEIFDNNLVIGEATYGNYDPFSTVGSGYQGLEYSMYPAEMAPNLHFRTTTWNWGAQTQTGCRLNIDLTNDALGDTIHSGTSNQQAILPDESRNFSLPTYQLSQTQAPYSVHFQMTQDQEDQDPEASRAVSSFEVTDVIYARDRRTTEGVYVPVSQFLGTAYEVGNYYQITANDQTAESISIGLGAGTNLNGTVYGRIYKLNLVTDNFVPELIAETGEYGVISAAINNVGDENLMTLPLTTPVTLTKDSAYLVVAGAPGGANDVLFPVSGDSPDLSSMVRFFPGTWFYFVRTPLVRLNFGPVVGTEEASSPVELDVTCYPNPANTHFTLRAILPEAAPSELRIFDQTGRVVHAEAFGTLSSGEHRQVIDVSRLAAGWYVMSLTAGEQVKNEMIVIRR